MPTSSLTLEQQYPLLTASGRKMLHRLEEHPHAPRYNHFCGNRLTQAGLQQVQAFDALVQASPPAWQPGQIPAWVTPFMNDCMERVPFYRNYGSPPASFLDLPAFSRAQLAHTPWLFVPDDLPLDDLIVYGTSGTTGHPIDIPCSPAVSHMYLPMLRAALKLWGIDWEGGADRVACLLVCSQATTYTLTSISPYLGDAGWAKINLNPSDWPTPDSPVHFINDCNPEIFTGDPLAFADLAKLPVEVQPKALVSSAMAFLPGLRQKLEDRFGCPVIDLYSMTEAGPIAALDPAGRGHLLIQPQLYVEVLDPDGSPCAPGEMGEITLTGGFNPYLPLLRYRTNDYARLVFSGRQPVLVDLQGRPPTLFHTATGHWINNVDVNNVLRPFPLAQFQMHQHNNGNLRLQIQGDVDLEELRKAVLELFGAGQVLTIEPLTEEKLAGEKILQYSSDLPFS